MTEIDGYPTYKEWEPQGHQDSFYNMKPLVKVNFDARRDEAQTNKANQHNG